MPTEPDTSDLELIYSDESITIYHGDNSNYLTTCPDDYFNIVHTDPPYNEVNRENIEGWAYFDKGGADSLPVDATKTGILLSRIASEWLYIWCGSQQFSEFITAIEEAGMSSRIGGWHKASPVPTAASKKWLSAFELCAIGRKPKANFNLHAASPIFFGEREFQTSHPTEKPLWLVSSLVDAVVHEGATLLDPYMGSGSSLEAAKKAGITAVGIDINKEYCESAAQRLSQDTIF